jgi:hypothetical protein
LNPIHCSKELPVFLSRGESRRGDTWIADLLLVEISQTLRIHLQSAAFRIIEAVANMDILQRRSEGAEFWTWMSVFALHEAESDRLRLFRDE